MRCICCSSNRIASHPLTLKGYHYCVNCGLLFRAEGKDDYLRRSLANHYQNVDPHTEVAKAKNFFFNYALDSLSLQSVKGKRSVLDVGCGHGYFLEQAMKRGWKVSGVEIADEAARGAKARVGIQDIFQGTLKEARYPDNFFDVVTLWDVLVHVESPFEELQECFRVLKGGGRIGIRVRNVSFQKIAYRAYSLIRKIGVEHKIRRPYVFHRYCFSSKAIAEILLRAGFEQIQVTNSPLTRGDPYGYTDMKLMVRTAKALFEVAPRIAFLVSRGRWIIAPSLVVWARKP